MKTARGHSLEFHSGLTAASILLWRQNIWGTSLVFLTALGLAAWGGVSVGLKFWLLLPFVGWAAVLAIWLALRWMWRPMAQRSGEAAAAGLHSTLRWMGSTVPLALILISAIVGSDAPHTSSTGIPAGNATSGATDWPVVGQNAAGTRYSPASQITPANVHKLKPVWTYRTGDLPVPGQRQSPQMFEATPIKIGDVL